MVVNNLPQQFVIYFNKNYFYPEVHDRWSTIVRRMDLPYMSVEDFMNSQIKSITTPTISLSTKSQVSGQYNIQKRPGKELDAIIDKSFTITFKLTESYVTYLIMRDQIELYLKYFSPKDLYWPPVTVDYLSDEGFTYMRTSYNQVTPVSLSELSLSYSAELASYKEFSLSFAYNYIDYFIVEDEKLTKIN